MRYDSGVKVRTLGCSDTLVHTAFALSRVRPAPAQIGARRQDGIAAGSGSLSPLSGQTVLSQLVAARTIRALFSR